METNDSDEDSSVNGDISESSDSMEPEVEKHKCKRNKVKTLKHKKDLCETSKSDSDTEESHAKHHKKRKKKTSSHTKPAPKSGLKSPMMPLAAAATASLQTVSLDLAQLSNLVQYVQ